MAYYYQNWLKYCVIFGPRKMEGEWLLEMPFEGSEGIMMRGRMMWDLLLMGC